MRLYFRYDSIGEFSLGCNITYKENIMNKVKKLVDVVSEVKKEAPQDVPNWNS